MLVKLNENHFQYIGIGMSINNAWNHHLGFDVGQSKTKTELQSSGLVSQYILVEHVGSWMPSFKVGRFTIFTPTKKKHVVISVTTFPLPSSHMTYPGRQVFCLTKLVGKWTRIEPMYIPIVFHGHVPPLPLWKKLEGIESLDNSETLWNWKKQWFQKGLC